MTLTTAQRTFNELVDLGEYRQKYPALEKAVARFSDEELRDLVRLVRNMEDAQDRLRRMAGLPSR